MEKDIARGQMVVNKLWNASRFISTASEGFDGKKPKQLKPMDAWLLSKLMKLVKKATDDFNEYQYSDARTGAEDFFWHSFCDNYLEAVKYRLYDSKDASAQWTLNTTLLTLLKLFAPVLPHITEELYQKMFRQEKAASIHASAWPEADEKLVDDNTERAGDDAVAVMTAVRAWKHENKMPLNAPLKTISIEAGQDEKKAIEAFLPDIMGATKATKVTFGPGKVEVQGTKLKFTAV
jgi:valyl-tRNA synthetase